MNKNIKYLVFGVCVASVLFGVLAGLVDTKTWYVDDSGGADFTKIQDAVNAASAGDTIIVKSGTYYEHVNITKRLNLVGQGSPVVDAKMSGSAITLSSDEIHLECFNVVNSSPGIEVLSDNNIIINNKASNNFDGIVLRNSDNNLITSNNAYLNNLGSGIHLYNSSNNTINSNNVSNNTECGIYLGNSNHNTITRNNALSNGGWLEIRQSNNNILKENTFINGGLVVIRSYQNTMENNTVNGKPLVYLENESNIEIKIKDAGQVILVKCNNVTVKNLNLSHTSAGIELLETNNSEVMNNRISNTHFGFLLLWSNNNTISSNNASNNSFGFFSKYSNNNKIHLNNFINNTDNIFSYELTNIWNSTSKITYSYNGTKYTNYPGNYWSDYTGSDTDGDGIGDTPYSIDSNADYYPLMEPWENYFKPTKGKYL